jgi:thioredoxin-related protein
MNRLLLLFVLCLPVQLRAQPDGWQPLGQAFERAAQSGTPILVYVDASWCGPCVRMERETFADPSIAARLDGFARARLGLNAYDAPVRVGGYRMSEADWAARLGATSTPTLILLSSDGAVLARHTGFLPPDGLAPLLDAVLISTSHRSPR